MDDDDLPPTQPLEYDEQGIPYEVLDLPEDDFWDDDEDEDRLAA